MVLLSSEGKNQRHKLDALSNRFLRGNSKRFYGWGWDFSAILRGTTAFYEKIHSTLVNHDRMVDWTKPSWDVSFLNWNYWMKEVVTLRVIWELGRSLLQGQNLAIVRISTYRISQRSSNSIFIISSTLIFDKKIISAWHRFQVSQADFYMNCQATDRSCSFI